MSTKVSVGVAAVFAVFMLGFAQPGGTQSTATGDVPEVRELYGMKMLSADAAGQVWENLNPHSVTAVWRVLGASSGDKSSVLSQVFKARETRTIVFPKGSAASYRIVMAYRDENERMLQANGAADYQKQTGDLDEIENQLN